jgi:ribosomal protein S27AE
MIYLAQQRRQCPRCQNGRLFPDGDEWLCINCGYRHDRSWSGRNLKRKTCSRDSVTSANISVISSFAATAVQNGTDQARKQKY